MRAAVMNLKHSLLAIAMSTVFVSQVQAADAAKQAVVDALASNLVVKYEVVTNDGAGAGLDCQALGPSGRAAALPSCT